jgi:amino acid adenylation domain-containing protein
VTLEVLLDELHRRYIRLWADGGQLRCNAPAGALTPELRGEIERRKPEILALLRSAARDEAIPRRSNRASAPLSYAQRQIWVLDQLSPGNPAYNMPYGFRLRGALDVRALESALNALIERHEILRTTFAAREGEPVQIVHPALSVRIRMTDLRGRAAEERERLLQALATEESVAPFDLSRLPLMRAALFRLDALEHVLIINPHHIIADGLSMPPLLQELDAFYEAFRRGSGPPRLPALAVQYGDFAAWQRQALAEPAAAARQLEYWTQRLGGAPPVLELPRDRPRPARQSFEGSNVFFRLPAERLRELKALGAREGCTFFMTVLAAYQVLLHRYTGQAELVIGTPVAARNRRELEPLIGVLLNMVALRCDASGEPSFVQLLHRSREATLDAFSHGDLPLELLMERLRIERDPSRNPIFQAALQMAPSSAVRLGDLQVESFEFDLGFAQFDLTLHLYEEADGGCRGRFEYCTALFEAQTARRLCGHFLTLLESIVRAPEDSIAALPMLGADERRQVLEEWNRTAATYPPARCVHELVEEQALQRPDALAAEQQGRQLTYRGLDEWANRVAWRLREQGAGDGARVAIFLDRSLEMLVAALAVWKAGGAYVPIDPDYPAERVRFMLQDAQAAAVLTRRALASRLPAPDAPAWLLEDAAEPADAGPPRLARSPDLLAYVIYTSGSTGRPKGVAVTHAGLFNLICWHRRAYAVTPADRATQVASPAFDAWGWEVWPYLAAGASVHIPDEARRLDEGRLVRWLLEKQITLTFQPTALAESALREGWPDASALRFLLTGGDRLSQRPARGMPFRLVNHYGPTENTVVSTCCEVAPGEEGVAPPIGRPLPNTQAYVVDRRLQPVPVGVPGELLLGGVQVAAGYWKRPELTAEKFVADPFHPGSAARLYRSGDLVRWRPDGDIEFLGRIDTQVKIRGLRIEPGEIEACIARHPAVREVVVLAREDDPGDKRLAAYVAAPDARPELERELRARLRAALPQYMMPADFVVVAALPRTPHGKIDRAQLPRPARREANEGARARPRTPTEAMVMTAFSDVLQRADFGLDADFFDLGGHSLMAARLVARLQRESGQALALRHLFEHPSVTALAGAIDALAWRQAAAGPATRGRGAVEIEL